MHLNLRRTLTGAAAFALAAGMSTVLVGGLPASATTSPNGPTVTCTFGTTVHFPAPGLSASGSNNQSKTDTTSTDQASTNCGAAGGTGTFPAENIVSKATKCKGAGSPVAGCDVKGNYNYDSESGFASTGVASIVKSLKKLSFSASGGTDGSITWSIKNSSATELVGQAPCAGNEVGFQITGAIKGPKSPLNYKGGTSTLTACLLGDTGPGTSGNFESDLLSGTGTIATATIDSATSSLVLTS